MKELQEILQKIVQFGDGERAILATVVDVVGSGYRRPGARMLIDENGFAIGTVSGGCLEADVLERAKKVLETGEAVVITYDTTQDENSVFGLSMGCRGIVRILLEKVEHDNKFFNLLRGVFESRKSFSTATVIFSSDENLPVGARLFFNGSEAVSENFESEISNLLIEKLKSAADEKKSNLEVLDVGEVFFETINPPLNLLLFGAGFDALPVVKFAKELGWRVSVIDHRAAYANRERLPEADEIIVSNSEDLDEKIFQDENSVGVIITHNYERDRNILRRLLHSKCLYVGALGPKTRTDKLLAEIGENFSDEQLRKLHAPVGLDIGAETPEEIALAIIAEIRAVLSNRNGNFLRERIGSISGK